MGKIDCIEFRKLANQRNINVDYQLNHYVGRSMTLKEWIDTLINDQIQVNTMLVECMDYELAYKNANFIVEPLRRWLKEIKSSLNLQQKVEKM